MMRAMGKYQWIGLVAISLACHGVIAATKCDALAAFASQNGLFIPGDDAGRVVTGGGRLQFYSAPDFSCKMEGIFIVTGDTVDAYSEYNGFTSVVYFPKADKKAVIGWVRSHRLQPNGFGISGGQN
ncbi:hypothetical protein C0Z18_16215 [Trinickia dabaoshanensis]|uniref:Uncharacterized protein n=1 Tax=Trinickia dabaoshanensis TaxID=564714 RepID=A0A2N7VNX3_9BURK|nr:hypothetical protein [Trinickia dabaoshanensis]PMS18864.1 hypothetical protein C0Z18_16215 [Trinickia dabaoshanensis]